MDAMRLLFRQHEKHGRLTSKREAAVHGGARKILHLRNQMDVIGHQTEGVNTVSEARHPLLKQNL
jgi:hypothetical protein